MATEVPYVYESWQRPTSVDTYWSPDTYVGPMTLYDIWFTYKGHAGVILMPVSGAPTQAQVGAQGTGAQPVNAELVQCYAPWMMVTVRVLAQRKLLPCIIPDWRPPSQSSKYVLKTWEFSGRSQTPDTDGRTYIFDATGLIEYYLRVPLTPDDGYPMGAAPCQTLPTAVMGVTPDQFNRAIFPL